MLMSREWIKVALGGTFFFGIVLFTPVFLLANTENTAPAILWIGISLGGLYIVLFLLHKYIKARNIGPDARK
ncbi:hypothetical protein AM501_19535 [Aneurinibacillus migulanus]|jgi:hypothetical protein|uniref:Uncharacterized protein n=1 Tax=Aneurinibacillus migulanus TaxID=47500 RepID=A0A0D1Y586_ANEMI|nr:hypothetical protein [Aneurinibacillus migulanus]KIV51886.1 hypothetical protein TS65_25325 [Aneurinibacillus migulanus]KIV54417.1 hypothetical protein TS64_15295 [Aneurinibacillus migulanus]KON98007.1 hypothetical protein AF333_23805 [Aneurinibacillus migulanus]KPD06813.1 hypothetical protein AM501_19535 [Aneurinibacillus migulanus]MCP1354181.1 hypothetical protein [Aneurinibacillus migulanus]